MKKYKLVRRALVSFSIVFAGGTVFANGCINAVASLPICGGILPFCDSFDQLNLLFPLLETPDFDADPSCTIPLGCGGGDLFDIPQNPDGPGFPGGGAPDQPTDDDGGGLGGGGGGGGGGI